MVRLRSAAAFAVLGALAAPAAAQLAVTAVNVADGQAGLRARDTLRFTFSRDLPFNSLYTGSFRWEPRARAFRRETFFDGGTRVRYVIDHAPDTDYAVHVFGVRASDGSRMARPFVLNYTTAPVAGTRVVTGTAAFSDGVPAKTGGAATALRARVEGAYDAVRRAPAPPLPATSGAPADTDLDRTVVLLLDGFSLDPAAWPARAAAGLDGDGAFRFGHVREGTYWPVALHFTDATGTTLDAYGFHDADGDLAPDPVAVTADGAAGLNVVLLRDAPFTAADRAALAARRARAVAADARLAEVAAAPGTDGRAALWRYTFYAPSADSLVVVDAGPVTAAVYVAPAEPARAAQAPFPAAFADSDGILAAAEAAGGAAFRAAHPAALVSVDGGDLLMRERPPRPQTFWRVRYETAPGDAAPAAETFYFDATTGARLAPTAADAPRPDGFGLDAPTPHPAAGPVRFAYRLGAAGATTVAVYDALGRRVATLVDDVRGPGAFGAAFDAGALPAGLYVVRLAQGDRRAARPFVVGPRP